MYIYIYIYIYTHIHIYTYTHIHIHIHIHILPSGPQEAIVAFRAGKMVLVMAPAPARQHYAKSPY